MIGKQPHSKTTSKQPKTNEKTKITIDTNTNDSNSSKNNINTAILHSPFHCNAKYNPSYLKSTHNIEYQAPISQSIINQQNLRCEQKVQNILKHTDHIPPHYKVSGHENKQLMSPIQVHKILHTNSSEVLTNAEQVSKTIEHESKIKQRRLKMKNRYKLQMADITYDLDGDGVVSNEDYAIAKFFDKDSKGKLNANQREKAVNACGQIHRQYRFSAAGIHKLTDDEIAQMNGGWMKMKTTADSIRKSSRGRLELLQKRKKQLSVNETKIANDYQRKKSLAKIEIEFPYHIKQLQAKSTQVSKENGRVEAKESVNKNRIKSRSHLLAKQKSDHMSALEKCKTECEQYFQPIAFRKLQSHEKFLKQRMKHTSKRTMNDIQNERHSENIAVGKYWQKRTNFEMANVQKRETNFWKQTCNKHVSEDVHRTSCAVYNYWKKSQKDSKLQPFECQSHDIRSRDKRFLKYKNANKKMQIKPEYQLKNKKDFVKYLEDRKRDTLSNFCKKVNRFPNDVCIMHGGRHFSAADDGVESWFKPRPSSLSDTLPVFSSFSRDNVYREPIASVICVQQRSKKTNLFETNRKKMRFRPNTAPLGMMRSTEQMRKKATKNNYSMTYRYSNNIGICNGKHQNRIKKYCLRTSGIMYH